MLLFFYQVLTVRLAPSSGELIFLAATFSVSYIQYVKRGTQFVFKFFEYI